MKNIAVFLGSINDLGQCLDGLRTLDTFAHEDKVRVIVYVRSAHRHIGPLQDLLDALSTNGKTDTIIAGAGKAAILPGFADAYLRNQCHDTKINVIGVGFTGENDRDTIAATLSITQAPGTQVIYAGRGWQGFQHACEMACTREDFPTIKLPEIPLGQTMSLEEAIKKAQELNQKP